MIGMKIQIAVLSLALLMGVACGDDGGNGGCADQCSRTIAGGCQILDMGQCVDLCGVLRTAADAIGCLAELDAMTACQNGSADICSAECNTEFMAYQACEQAYCAANPSEPICTPPAGSRMPDGGS